MQVGGNSRYGRSQNTGSKHSVGGASQECQKTYKNSENANLGECIKKLDTSSYNQEKIDLLAELKDKYDINNFKISSELMVDPEQGYQILNPTRGWDNINENLGPAPKGTFESLMPALDKKFGDDNLLDVYMDLKEAARIINEGPSQESFSKEAFSKEAFSKEAFSKEAFGEMSQYGAKLQRTLSEESGKTDKESVSTSRSSSPNTFEDLFKADIEVRTLNGIRDPEAAKANPFDADGGKTQKYAFGTLKESNMNEKLLDTKNGWLTMPGANFKDMITSTAGGRPKKATNMKNAIEVFCNNAINKMSDSDPKKQAYNKIISGLRSRLNQIADKANKEVALQQADPETKAVYNNIREAIKP